MARMKPPHVPEAPPAVLTEEQLRRLLKVCEGKGLLAKRDSALLRLLLDTGRWRAELSILRVEDIDFEQNIALVGHAANAWGSASTAAEPPSRRWRARTRRSRRLPSQTKGVGWAFQPATASSSQPISSSALCGCCPANARPTTMRWSDSAMFSHEPLSGVYSGITPC